MTVLELILTVFAQIILLIVLVRYKNSKESTFENYLFDRGLQKFLYKGISIVTVLVVWLFWIGRLLSLIKWEFLNQKL